MTSPALFPIPSPYYFERMNFKPQSAVIGQCAPHSGHTKKPAQTMCLVADLLEHPHCLSCSYKMEPFRTEATASASSTIQSGKRDRHTISIIYTVNAATTTTPPVALTAAKEPAVWRSGSALAESRRSSA